MNIQLKQRLVGAIVLVALAVIFIPMLLPGAGNLTGSISGSNIPPEPDYRFSPIPPAPKAPAMATAPNMPMSDEALSKAASSESQADKSVDAPLKSAALSPKPKPTASASIAKKPLPNKKPTVVKTVPSKAKPPTASGWVVQVGSFSSSRNARALRDKLRKQGHASFVEETNAASGAVYRVRVGPQVSRKSAERLRQKLAEAAGLKGLVQAYP